MELTVEKIQQAVKGQLTQGSPHHLLKGVSTDSRTIKAGELFVSLKGDRFDGHLFINDALAKGASGVMLNRECNLREFPSSTKDAAVIQVNDTLRALGDLASFWMQQNNATVVAITGSNGKTTTREMTATILEQSHDVLKPEHNLNNLIGVPLTLLRLNPHHNIAVVEMGMNRRGEIKRLSQIAQPHIGLITNISHVHLQYLESINTVAQAKGELFESLTSGDHAVINTDEPLVLELSRHCSARKLTFGINHKARVTATDVHPSDYSTNHFTLKIEGESLPITLKICGIHNIYNALAAASIATIFKLTPEQIKAGLECFTAFSGRMEISIFDQNICIINDTYNANPKSMEIALKTLARLKGKGRGIAVLGDMLELGEASETFHQHLGSLIRELSLDAVFLMGSYAEVVAESAMAQGVSEEAIYIGKTHEQIAEKLTKKVKADDCLLFKGSRGMKLEKVLARFLQMRGKGSKGFPLTNTATAGCNN